MVGWHHQLNGHEFEQVLGAGEGQGCKELDMIERLNKYIYTHIWKGIYYRNWLSVMEAEMSYCLLSASWTPRKGSGIV